MMIGIFRHCGKGQDRKKNYLLIIANCIFEYQIKVRKREREKNLTHKKGMSSGEDASIELEKRLVD